MNQKYLCAIAAMTTVAFCCGMLSASETSKLKDRFPRYDLDEKMNRDVAAAAQTFIGILFKDPKSRPSGPVNLFQRVKPQIGFEEKRYLKGESPIKFDYSVEQLTLRRALDLLVEKDADYVWEMAGGVINIIPKDSELNIRVSSFTVDNIDIYSALSILIKQIGRPNIQHALQSNIARQETIYPYYRNDGPRIKVSLTNATLRDCLNALVRQDGLHDWHLRHYSTDFKIEILPRMSGLSATFLRTEKRRNKEFEEKSLREGFRKGKDGTWSKPGPGGKWGAPATLDKNTDANKPGRKDAK